MPRIIVVGAGLAGLASALALRRSGHQVQIFEASQLLFEHTEGPVVQIGPKVNDILKKWEFDAEVARGVLIEEVSEYDLGGLPRKSEGSQPPGWMYFQRSRLHKALMDAAKAPSGAGQPVEIFLNTRVISAQGDTGVVVVEDGRSFTGDLVIGADGLHSTTRKAFPNDIISAGPTKLTVHFRVATAKLEDNAVIKRFQIQPQKYEKWVGDNVELKVFSVDSEHIIFDTTLPILSEAGLSPTFLKKQISDAFVSADSQIRELLDAVNPEDIQFWSYNSMPHVERWTSKRLVLIGDAAHPFLPYELPGTSQSITGAEALDEVFTTSFGVEEIQARLQAWEIVRKERVEFIQGLERKAWPSN
ncbi:unnamed protein product [Penicillium glandicola]